LNRGIIAAAMFVALFAGACSAPLSAPTRFATLAPVPLTLAPALVPTITPTILLQPTSTPPTAASVRLTPTLAPSTAPQTPIAAVSPSAAPTNPTAGFPPGVYVTELRTDPNPPNRTAQLTFYVTFANSMGSPQNYRWIVYIYRFDAPTRSTGETTQTQVLIPNGSSEQKSDGFWRLGPGSQCENFFARVAWLDQDKRATNFSRPDGKVFEKNLTLCP
jgi:hypothetical protein